MYEPVIGIEIHARINAKTKLFCRCLNEAVPEHPNKNVCPICMGFPGMLPQTNGDAVMLGIKGALALQCTINEYSKFDRKNYFYPDLPMGYQISQFDQPVGIEGKIEIELPDGERRCIRIERLHLENDAGKLSHGSTGSFVDFNRSGAPLMEIVSGPDMRGVEDASAYAREMQNVMRATGASDCDMEKGQMRFDLNISLRPVGREQFGTKVEIKNLNSFKSLEKAIVFEIDRQAKVLDAGENVIQETRGWDDAKEKTVSQRSKEEAADYRYFPEPDIPPLTFTKEQIANITAQIPELPSSRRARFIEEYAVDRDTARILGDDTELAEYFEKVVAITKDGKASAPWITTVLQAILKEEKVSLQDLPFTADDVATIVKMVAADELSHLNGKEAFQIMYSTGEKPEAIIEKHGFKQVSDTGALEAMVEEAIKNFPSQVEEYKSGKEQLLGFFVGQVMKASKGSANPKVVGDILKSKLS